MRGVLKACLLVVGGMTGAALCGTALAVLLGCATGQVNIKVASTEAVREDAGAAPQLTVVVSEDVDTTEPQILACFWAPSLGKLRCMSTGEYQARMEALQEAMDAGAVADAGRVDL